MARGAMMLETDAYSELLKSQNKILGKNGFKRKGSAFARKNKHYWHVIGWQKSRESRKEMAKFTLNIGVNNLKLAAIEGNDVDKFPDVHACHYLQRVGFLMPVREDHWWEVSNVKLDLLLEAELSELLITIVFPFFEGFVAADSLLDLWKNGKSPGQTDFTRKRYISLLDNS